MACNDVGVLKPLLGVWKGKKGMDRSLHRAGAIETPFHETLTFTGVGQAKNADEQVLDVIRYHQVVQRLEDDVVFHDEVGYWMWDGERGIVIQSLAIPRGVTLLAGGTLREGEGLEMKVKAESGVSHWNISQSPFMSQKAKTTAFEHSITLVGNTLSYEETTHLEIYGQAFEHTDRNSLEKISEV